MVIRTLCERVVIIDLTMMSYETEFNYIVPGEFECDSIAEGQHVSMIELSILLSYHENRKANIRFSWYNEMYD